MTKMDHPTPEHSAAYVAPPDEHCGCGGNVVCWTCNPPHPWKEESAPMPDSAESACCRKCGQAIEGEGFGSPNTGWEHPFSCPPKADLDPTLFCRRCERLGSQCSCTEQFDG